MINPFKIKIVNFNIKEDAESGKSTLPPFKIILGDFPITQYLNSLRSKLFNLKAISSSFVEMTGTVKSKIKTSFNIKSIQDILTKSKSKSSTNAYSSSNIDSMATSTSEINMKVNASNYLTEVKTNLEDIKLKTSFTITRMINAIFYPLSRWYGKDNNNTIGSMYNSTLSDLSYGDADTKD